MNYIETECNLPLPEHSQKFHNSFRDTDKFFHMKSYSKLPGTDLSFFFFFLFISRLDFYEKRRGEEKVSRSPFSFLLDKLSQQRCSWEISDRNKITVSGLLFLSCFSFPTAWQKASLCFTVPWNYLLWKALEAAEPVRIPWWSVLAWGCTLSHSWSLSLLGWLGNTQVAAPPSHHLELHSYCAAPQNGKEMGSNNSSLTKKTYYFLGGQKR